MYLNELGCKACTAIATAYRALEAQPKVVGIGQHPVHTPANQRIADALYAGWERHNRWHAQQDEIRRQQFEARMRAEGRVERWDDEEREYVWSLPGTF